MFEDTPMVEMYADGADEMYEFLAYADGDYVLDGLMNVGAHPAIRVVDGVIERVIIGPERDEDGDVWLTYELEELSREAFAESVENGRWWLKPAEETIFEEGTADKYPILY